MFRLISFLSLVALTAYAVIPPVVSDIAHDRVRVQVERAIWLKEIP